MLVQDIIKHIKSINLPDGEYIVFGSCPMTVAGLRESSDVDVLISEVLYDRLLEAGWEPQEGKNGDKPLEHGIFDAHTNWHIGDYNPTLKELLLTATVIDGVPFAHLFEVRNWKAALGRPKDLADIELIDNSGLLG